MFSIVFSPFTLLRPFLGHFDHPKAANLNFNLTHFFLITFLTRQTELKLSKE